MKNPDISEQMKKAAAEAEEKYGDILYVPHPVSKRQKKAPRTTRAAQFSPFAALSGYEQAIRETSRETMKKPELSEDEKVQLDRQIQKLLNEPTPRRILLTWFEEDQRKEGGSFRSAQCTIESVSGYQRILCTDSGMKIPLDDIVAIEEI